MDQRRRIWVIDINPFGEPTCPLLFEWPELLSFTSLQSRVVENQEEVLQGTAGRSRGPVDVHMAEDFPRFLEICKLQNEEEGHDE
jgi:hypothetical protein